MFLRPASPDLIVPMPERNGARLPEQGQEVPNTPYWHRRLREGSVIEGKAPAEKSARAKSERPTE